MKIVYVCNEYPPRHHGGIGTFVQDMARGMSQKGHDVTVVGLAEANHEYEDQGVQVVTLRANKTGYLGSLISRIGLHRCLSSRARSGKIDIIDAPEFGGFLPFRDMDGAANRAEGSQLVGERTALLDLETLGGDGKNRRN